MDIDAAHKVLNRCNRQGRWVFTRRDLAHVFPEDGDKALSKGLARLTDKGLLERVCRGVYVYALGAEHDSRIVERIAVAMRRGEYNYLSLESLLSEHGAISQIPIDRLTVMTTGRKGTYRTPYGVIEFTHTARPVEDILAHTVKTDARPLRLATLPTAWRDLKRVGRNLHLVDRKLIEHARKS